MPIPVNNIYYLLCYAWNKLEEKGKVRVAEDGITRVLDLFARVLINATHTLMKKGLDKNYISYTDELSGIKGKLELASTFKKHPVQQQKTICSFDELSMNILPNRILVATIKRLIATQDLDRKLCRELKALLHQLGSIPPEPLNAAIFAQLIYNRNNSSYEFVMQVCRLIYDCTLPSETPGSYYFADFTRDDTKMNRVFEAFLRNFYKREQRRYPKVGGERIRWAVASCGPDEDFLPAMQTDITLQNDTEKVIIDAKYYQQTMTVNFNKERINSSNLYQLFSYLQNQRKQDDPKTLETTGILLYPTVGRDYALNYQHGQHRILVRTVDLGSSWEDIEAKLKQIVETL